MTTRPKPAHDDGQRRLAVLIDADNAQASVIEGLLAEVAKYGLASVKRIYGDFTSQQLGQWKKVLLKHSISSVQQFAYTVGKNATDSSLIIDAMDLMYTGRFDGMCLVTSDSDFTRLAQRLREVWQAGTTRDVMASRAWESVSGPGSWDRMPAPVRQMISDNIVTMTAPMISSGPPIATCEQVGALRMPVLLLPSSRADKI